MLPRAARPLDIIVYGATGFTGEAVARALAQRARGANPRRWAIGGRDSIRLGRTRDRMLDILGGAGTAGNSPDKPPATPSFGPTKEPGADRRKDVQVPEIIVADAVSDDRTKLATEFGKARVLINCAGPFARFGQNVVQACIDAGTDYVDISGEPQFILAMMRDEHTRAKENAVLVVSACGFDSMPADLGCKYVSDELDRLVTEQTHPASIQTTHIESFLHISPGAVGHATTLECALIGFSSADKTRRIRRQLPQPSSSTTDSDLSEIRKRAPVLQVHGGIFRDRRPAERDAVNACFRPFCVPFPGSDATVVKQTQRLEALEEEQQLYRPVKNMSYAAYVVIGNWLSLGRFLLYGALCYALVQFTVGRRLIMKYPALFTGGFFSHEGPTERQRASTSITFDFFGKRFIDGAENARVVAQVSMPRDPGYTGTAQMVIAAAETLLDERGATPKGGVLTPAAAFGKTSLQQRVSGCEFIEFGLLKSERTGRDS